MILDNVGAAALPITPCSAEGALMWDTNGKTYWDFYGGHAVTLLGQGHPRWVDAIADQARKLSFFTTLAPVPVRDRAAKALCAFTGLDSVFFVNCGAEANEAALKIARKATGRPVIIAFEHGFHGRTMGALGATWKYRDQHAPAHGPTRFVPYGDLEALERAMDDDVAGIIVEPVQGIAGVVVPPEGFLAGVRRLCDRNGSVLIADEIQCGIGRMGVPLVSTAQGVLPDLVTVGKGLGGGFPVAAVLLTQAMADTVKPGEHGTTFGGGPLACAAVESTLAIIADEALLERSHALYEAMRTALMVPGVLEVRGGGAWAGVVLDRPAKSIHAALLDAGFMVGTAGDPHVLRLAPPAVTPISAVYELAEALRTALGGAMVQQVSSAA
ncbi:MAG: aminotransferase class III-fold pyridoxal phosphate-dependent enzyme [Myxococcota bacterium]